MTNLMQVTETETVSMSSLEIAELTGKRHDSVKRTIEILSQATDKRPAIIQLPHSVEVKNHLGQSVTQYVFSGDKGKRDSIVVVARLSPEFTAMIVDRWQELETQVQNQQLEILNLRRSQLLHDYSDSIGQIAQAWTQITQAKQDLSQTHKNLKAFVDDQVNRLREHSIEVRCEGHDETADFLIELSKKIKRESSGVKVDSSNSIKEWLSNSEKLLNHYLSEKLKAN